MIGSGRLSSRRYRRGPWSCAGVELVQRVVVDVGAHLQGRPWRTAA
jgi:hypothetical protein